MKKQFEESIKIIEQQIKELQEEWDKIDSTNPRGDKEKQKLKAKWEELEAQIKVYQWNIESYDEQSKKVKKKKKK